MARASLYVGSFKKTIEVTEDDYSVEFEINMPEGKFNMEAFFTDQAGRFFPGFYVYVEKL